MAEAVGAATNLPAGIFRVAFRHRCTFGHPHGADADRVYDRHGAMKRILAPPGHYMDPRISPDGRKVAWSRVDPARLAQDIWVFDFDRQTTTRMTSHPLLDASPVWSRDSAQILNRLIRRYR